MTMTTPICDLIDVTKHYGNHVVLDRFKVQIEPQEMVAIVGPSGAVAPVLIVSLGVLAVSVWMRIRANVWFSRGGNSSCERKT